MIVKSCCEFLLAPPSMWTWVISAPQPLASGSAAGWEGPAPQNAPPARTGGPAVDAHCYPGATALPHSRSYMGPPRPMPRGTWESGRRRGGEGRDPPRASLRPRPTPRRSPNETLGAALRRRRSPTAGADAVHSKPRGGTTTVRSDEQPPRVRTAPPGRRRAESLPAVRPGRGASDTAAIGGAAFSGRR